MRHFIVKCKTVKCRQKLKELDLKCPESPIDVRFHSYFSAMVTLVDNENAFRGLAELDDSAYMKDSTWVALREYIEYYRPLYELTMLLQKTGLTLRKEIFKHL
jgi:hypothetical protein